MERDKKFRNVIVCPTCGREYLPAEIFLPNSFFGKPEDVVRTPDGRIDFFDGTSMDLKESYVCDNCDAEFRVVANLSFKTMPTNDVSAKAYETPLTVTKISLFEE